jgi:hypothetical protein
MVTKGGVEFEILTEVVMKSSVVWNITLCRPMRVNRSLRGTYRLHLQGRRISQARNQREACRKELASRVALLATCFMLGLFFDLEDGGDMFLRNFG